MAVNGNDETFTGWGREDADLGNRLYHLKHPLVSRDRLETNQSLLEETIAERRIRARRGLDQYLAES
jgi:predicted glycosyltransferase involved in capsule biosynthesis